MDETVVRCGNCNRILNEDPGLDPSQREPCPDCESTSRRFEKTLADKINILAWVALEIQRTYYERSLPWLVANAVLIVVSGIVGGLVLTGWPSVFVSIPLGVVGFFVGLRALTRVRTIEHR